MTDPDETWPPIQPKQMTVLPWVVWFAILLLMIFGVAQCAQAAP